MQIFSPTRGVKYTNGYFVIYERKMSKESGKLSKWTLTKTYATPHSAVLADSANAELIPLYEESKRKAAYPKNGSNKLIKD